MVTIVAPYRAEARVAAWEVKADAEGLERDGD